ncbi:GRB2-associated-binding protein 2-like [Thomomys bottae]
MDGAYVVCSGWLRKAPREDKCGPVIWRRRWFVLRSGKMSGDPDVLQYYRSPGSQRPLRTIDLTFCQWVDAEVNFHTLRQPDGFVFAIETARRPFYLLADTEEAMYKWVDGICRLRGFVEIDQSTGRPLMQSPDGRASLEQPGAGSPGVTAGTLACSSAQDQGHGPSVDVGDAKKPGVISTRPPRCPIPAVRVAVSRCAVLGSPT